MKHKRMYLIGSVVFCSMIMSGIDAFLELSYFPRSLFKVMMFLIVPLSYFAVYKDEYTKIRKLFVPKKKDLLISLGLGAAVYLIIMTAYFLFRNLIDLNAIKDALLSSVGVSAENFIYVALYISFVNSLLEEFFFRGYAFILLKEQIKPLFAYLFSSVLFAFYHVGMTISWFHPVIYVLAMLGLMIGGLIFNALNDRFGTIYSSWLVHMCANFAINTVGFILFGIL